MLKSSQILSGIWSEQNSYLAKEPQMWNFLKKENLSTGYLSHLEISISVGFHGLGQCGIYRKEKLIQLSLEAGLASLAVN